MIRFGEANLKGKGVYTPLMATCDFHGIYNTYYIVLDRISYSILHLFRLT